MHTYNARLRKSTWVIGALVITALCATLFFQSGSARADPRVELTEPQFGGVPSVRPEELSSIAPDGAKTEVSVGQSEDIDDIGGIGVLCNYTSRRVYATWTPRGRDTQFRVGYLDGGYCNDPVRSDVEGIWGRKCTQGTCWYQTWKIGDGFFWLTTGNRFPLPPHNVVWISGWGYSNKDTVGWFWPQAQDRRWAMPDLYWMDYLLAR